MNESCRTYKWGTSQIRMRHATHTIKSCTTYEWVVSHIWLRHVAHSYEWIVSHIQICATYDSCRTYKYARHDSFIWMCMCNTINSYECVCATRLIHMNVYARHSFIWMNRVAHINEARHTYERVMSNTQLSHVTPVNESSSTYECAMSHIWMSHVTHRNESRHAYKWVISLIPLSLISLIIRHVMGVMLWVIWIKKKNYRFMALFKFSSEKRPRTIVSWFQLGFRLSFHWPFRVSSSTELSVLVML